MKKNQRIGMIEIEGNKVRAFDTDGVEVKLTRTQRSIFSQKPKKIKSLVEEEYQAPVEKVLADSFFIKRNGEVLTI